MLGKDVCAAQITVEGEGEEPNKEFVLYKGFTEEEKKQFMESLNFEYDAGYGSQKLFGTIWYDDGTFSERSEYDGSE